MQRAAIAFGVGSGAGLCGSLVGMGGGFVAIPSLTSLLALTQHQAHANALGGVLATGLLGSAGYFAAGHKPDLTAAGTMAASGMVTSVLGARAVANVPEARLKMGLGVLMLVVAPLLPLKEQLVAYAARMSAARQEPSSGGSSSAGPYSRPADDRMKSEGETAGPLGRGGPRESVPVYLALGAMSGAISGAFGVGGGVLTVPVLAYALPPHTPHREVVATSLAAMILPAFAGCCSHYGRGSLSLPIVLPLAAGTALGAFVGGKVVSDKVSERGLKYGFSALMLSLGVKTLWAAKRLPK